MTMDLDLDLVPDAVMRVDRDRRVVDANRAAEELTGFTLDQLRRHPLEALVDPRSKDGKPIWLEGWDRSTRVRAVRRIPEQEVEIRRADDRDVRVFVTGTYQRDGDGQVVGAVLVLRPAGRRAHLAATGIEIVSTVSHELRSPLTSVKGYTSLLLNRWDRLGEDQKRMMLEQVNHDADRVTRLITELLDISRLETGRLVLRRQLVDMPAVARRVADKVALEHTELDAQIEFAPDFPAVYADPDKIEQVLTNLVENAAKYASPRGLRIIGAADEREVSVSVMDKGEGIAPQVLARIFDKFYRAPETRPTGTGLGLWISRGLVEAHGGRMTVSSTVGEGSTFRFTLPVNVFTELHGL